LEAAEWIKDSALAEGLAKIQERALEEFINSKDPKVWEASHSLIHATIQLGYKLQGMVNEHTAQDVADKKRRAVDNQ
jgi:hypothetical protein